MEIFRIFKTVLILFALCLLVSCRTTPKSSKPPTIEDSKKEFAQAFEPPIDNQKPEQKKNATAIIAEKILANVDKEDFNVAVGEFLEMKGKSYVSSAKGKLISERLVTELVNSNNVTVIERSQLGKVLQELNLSMTGIIDANTAKEVGKILGIDALITGSVIDLGSYNEINARMINTENGKILAAVTTEEVIDVPEAVMPAKRLIEKKSVGRSSPSPRLSKANNVHKMRRKFEQLFKHHRFKKLVEEARKEIDARPDNLIAKLFLGMSLTEIGIKENNKNILENAARHLRFVLRNGKHPMMKRKGAVALLFALTKSGHRRAAKRLLHRILNRAPDIRNMPGVKKIIRELGDLRQ